jgi:hypothetical protein
MGSTRDTTVETMGSKLTPKANKQIGDELLITDGMTRSSKIISLASHLGIIFNN